MPQASLSRRDRTRVMQATRMLAIQPQQRAPAINLSDLKSYPQLAGARLLRELSSQGFSVLEVTQTDDSFELATLLRTADVAFQEQFSWLWGDALTVLDHKLVADYNPQQSAGLVHCSIASHCDRVSVG